VTLRRTRRIALFGAAIVAGLLLLATLLTTRQGAGTAGGSADGSLVPAPLAVGTALQRPRHVPPLDLIDEHGRPTSLAALHGRWVVLVPSMTLCHEVCPMTTGVLMQLTEVLRREGLAKSVAAVEVTVDPWRDSPARLRAYRRLTGANFTMLTGTQSEIARIWRFFGIYYKRVPQDSSPDIDWLTHRPETFDVEHADGFFLLDPSGQERVVEEGTPSTGGHLSPALRRLLSAEGRHNLADPQLPWNAGQLLDDLDWLMGRLIPVSALPTVKAPSAASAASMLAGSPALLQELHAQGGELLGGYSQLQERLAKLRGYAVVLNAWASWCPPCRAEFPIFAAVSAAYGRRVAFVGADMEDSASEARKFLAEHPVSYPSFQVSSAALDEIAPARGTPTTIFIDRAGHVVSTHTGQYETQATLAQDIARYALAQ
jgi:cytochrome oxidase Cu insertion factor (SCO1/SenC/PrrC family)/thiol-disulfide isomerase/thioredoxin